MKNVQNTVYIASFLASGVEFAIGIRTCATLAEAVVRVRVNDILAADACHIGTAAVDVLSALDYDGVYT